MGALLWFRVRMYSTQIHIRAPWSVMSLVLFLQRVVIGKPRQPRLDTNYATRHMND